MNGKNSVKPNQGLDDNVIESALLLCSDKGGQENLKEELKREREKLAELRSAPPEKVVISEFSKLDESLVFSEKAHYSLFNRDTKCEFFINGKELERRIGIDDTLFDKLKNRKIDTISVDNSIISFYKAVV